MMCTEAEHARPAEDDGNAVARWSLVLVVVVLCWPLSGIMSNWYTRYWLIRDGIEGTATIVAEHNHGVFSYKYTVDNISFDGRSMRNWQDEQYRHPKIGQEVPVWYSASHRQLSMLYKPDFTFDAFPFVFIVLIVQCAIIRGLWRQRGSA